MESTCNHNEDCFAVAFYGVSKEREALESYCQISSDWFSDLGHAPEILGVTGNGYAGRPQKFSRLYERVRKTRFSGVESVTVIAPLPNAKIPVDDYFLISGFDKGGRNAFLVVRSNLAQLSVDSMLPVIRRIISVIKPTYGIGYTRPHKYGPAMYALGICQGGPLIAKGALKEERTAISRWSGVGMKREVYRQGLLRDIYPWNFLTAPQLTRNVGGQSLEQWIRSDSARGSLTVLDHGVTLWEVDQANIAGLRPCLDEAGVIFDWRKFVQMPTMPLSPEESLRMVLEGYERKGVNLEDIEVLRGQSGETMPDEEVRRIAKGPKRKK